MSRGQNLTYYLKNLITFNLLINVGKKINASCFDNEFHCSYDAII